MVLFFVILQTKFSNQTEYPHSCNTNKIQIQVLDQKMKWQPASVEAPSVLTDGKGGSKRNEDRGGVREEARSDLS